MPILKVEVQGPEILPLWDIVDIEAARFEWRSWLWQEKNLPADHHLTPGVRAFMVGEAGSIQLIAAQHAFFSLDKAYINKLMAHLGYDMPAGRSLYETLCAAVAKVLGCNEERTHNIVHKRVVELKNAAAYTNELLHCDEAVQVMDRDDIKSFKAETAAAFETAKELKAFKGEYKAGRQRIREASKGQSSSGRRKASKNVVRQLPDLSTIPHHKVKNWAAPGANIWKNNTTGEWLGRLYPHKTAARSWRKHGEAEALRLVLRHTWAQYCDQEGLDCSECPVAGLFSEPPGASGAAASSSTGA